VAEDSTNAGVTVCDNRSTSRALRLRLALTIVNTVIAARMTKRATTPSAIPRIMPRLLFLAGTGVPVALSGPVPVGKGPDPDEGEVLLLFDESTGKVISEFRTSRTDSCPQGKSCVGGGPSQSGEYLLSPGAPALSRIVLYCTFT